MCKIFIWGSWWQCALCHCPLCQSSEPQISFPQITIYLPSPSPNNMPVHLLQISHGYSIALQNKIPSEVRRLIMQGNWYSLIYECGEQLSLLWFPGWGTEIWSLGVWQTDVIKGWHHPGHFFELFIQIHPYFPWRLLNKWGWIKICSNASLHLKFQLMKQANHIRQTSY